MKNKLSKEERREKTNARHRKWMSDNREKMNKYTSNWYSKNPHKKKEYREKRKEYTKLRLIQIKYGLSPKEYKELFNQTNNECPVCNVIFYSNGNGSHACVDHNHTTGKIRGIICRNCNVALGNTKDNPKILRALIEYLKD